MSRPSCMPASPPLAPTEEGEHEEDQVENRRRVKPAREEHWDIDSIDQNPNRPALEELTRHQPLRNEGGRGEERIEIRDGRVGIAVEYCRQRQPKTKVYDDKRCERAA